MATSLIEQNQQQLAAMLGQQQRSDASQRSAHQQHQMPQVMRQSDELDSSDDDDHFPTSQGFMGGPGADEQRQQKNVKQMRLSTDQKSYQPQTQANKFDQLLQGKKTHGGGGVKLPSVFQNNAEQVLSSGGGGGANNTTVGAGLQIKQQPGKNQGRKNPFNQRRQTAQEDDFNDSTFGPPPENSTRNNKQQNSQKPGERQNTAGTLNRNESQSQLTTSFEPMDQKEVELKAQSGENSQLFMESQFSNAASMNLMGNQDPSKIFNNIDGFGQREFDEDRDNGGNLSVPSQNQKVTVNLEDAYLEEQKLYQILESLRNNLNASLYCDDWWDVTETGHFATIVAYQVIKDPVLKQVMLKAQKFEAISIGIVQFYHLLAYEQTTIDTQTSVNTYLKNLMFYIHQQFLIVISITQSRIVNKKLSSWESQLSKIVDSKILKKLKNKSDATQQLGVYCSNCENIIRNISKANQNKRIFKIIDEWINNLQKIPIDRIRDVLYNIEQFKADALKLPNLKPSVDRKTERGLASKSKTSTSVDGPVIGDAAKSAGSLNNDKTSQGASKMLGNQGQTSLTGKNAFAVLKPSAIASASTVMFPNNFTNLPKVHPPFLDPLEPSESPIYTLVLDLDETLIHNVEYQNDSFFLVRPGCVQFIETMAKYYEIVIFTAALQEYADQVIDQIDVGNNIKYRLYRQHTSQNGPFLVKDLSLLGRDINKTIIIDNISDNFLLQPYNGIFISTWYDDMRDRFLDEITPLMCEIVQKKVPDVRKALRTYRDQILRQVSNGASAPSIVFQ